MHAIVILTLLWSTLAPCLSLLGNVNFTTCFAEEIQTLTQDCAVNSSQSCVWEDGVLKDPDCANIATQVCVYKKGVLTNPDRIFITYPACIRLCGNGWGRDDTEDMLFRISTWVIPAIILIAHFHFPPVGTMNRILIASHVLSDPIDSLWSLLTRIEIHRRLYNLAVARRLRSARAIATIWAAYDELNFHDPSGFFLLHLQIKRDSMLELGHFLEVAGYSQPSRSRTVQLPHTRTSQSISSTFWTWLLQRMKPAVQQAILNQEDERFIEMLSNTERRVIYLIERAAKRLVENRSASSLASWMSIFGLMGALLGAYVRTLMRRLENQTAHTIALVTLLFVVVPIVKLSSNVGAFTSTTAAVDIIQELRQKLPHEWKLFPDLRISNLQPQSRDTQALEVQSLLSADDEETSQLKTWPPIAAYSGMISSYRPSKISDQSGVAHSSIIFIVSFVLVIGVCYMPALFISYLAPLKGFACRSAAWTVIACLWVFSAVVDITLSLLSDPKNSRLYPRWRWVENKENMWFAVTRKDLIIATIITLIVMAQLIGFYNTCYCRSGEFNNQKPNFVNLNPLTDAEWDDGWRWWVAAPCVSLLTILLFVTLVELLVSDSKYLLNRGERDRGEMALHVRKLSPPKSDAREGYVSGAGFRQRTVRPQSMD
jgi:hypothetical protein